MEINLSTIHNNNVGNRKILPILTILIAKGLTASAAHTVILLLIL